LLGKKCKTYEIDSSVNGITCSYPLIFECLIENYSAECSNVVKQVYEEE